MKLTSRAPDLTIYAGDFNSEPCDVPYQLMREVAGLTDCWLECHGCEQEDGLTYDTPYNSYSSGDCRGKRIDYIMYRPGPHSPVSVLTEACRLPLQSRIPSTTPDKSVSFSDHEGVEAVLKLVTEDTTDRGDDGKERVETETLGLALQSIERAQARSRTDQVLYTALTCFSLALLGLSFSDVLHQSHLLVDCVMYLVRSTLMASTFYCLSMATIFNRWEE